MGVPEHSRPTVDRQGASPGNLTRFLDYMRLVYLSALRDPSDEFSSRSQFWGPILRSLNISEAQAKSLGEELQKLNEALLRADPRLEQVRSTLDNIQKVVSLGSNQAASIQALPFRPWELLSRSEVVLRASNSGAGLPLARHGQGIQSLAVLFLFQAYLDVLLKPLFQPETEAILRWRSLNPICIRRQRAPWLPAWALSRHRN